MPGFTMLHRPAAGGILPMHVPVPVPEAQEEDDLVFQDENDVYIRRKFFESWLWTDVDLPNIPANNDG